MKVTTLRPEAGHAPELETLFQASRQVEASLIRERNQNGQLASEILSLRDQHAQELARARQHLQTLSERDSALLRQLKAAHERTQSIASQAQQLKEQNARLKTASEEQSRKVALDLTAARSAFDHVRSQMRDHEETANRLKIDLHATRQELERAQAEVLEREHRYQAAVLNFQGRDQSQQTAIHALQDQLKQLQGELSRLKSRWIETEQKRQDAEKRREEAEVVARGLSPTQEKLRKLEETNQMLIARLSEEKKLRKEVEKALPSAEQGQEMNRIRSALHATEDRLALTEMLLSKASAEASLLKAVHHKSEMPQEAPAPAPTPEPVDFELLERLALTGYPVQDDA